MLADECQRCGVFFPCERHADVPAGDANLTDCAGCGQRRYCDPHDDLCGACVKASHEAQGSAVKLFEPAPTQLEGQLSF